MAKNPHPNVPVFFQNQLFLDRPRIHGLLAKALEGSVLIISAGEGYGKTFAVSSFLKTRSETVIWVQDSELDNQPWRFWENYTRAMGFCKPLAGRELQEIGFPETERQFSQWFEIDRREFSSPGKYVVVGDDFHRITSRVVLDFMDRVLAYPIPHHTLVLICRSEPALNIIPSLSKGRLTRIGAEELLFTREEIAGYFRMRHIDLSADEIAAIHRDTEGWPLSLGMVVAGIQKNGGRYTRPILEKGAFRIFEDDLFTSIPKVLQNYLVKLSLLEQLPLELLERTIAVLPEQYRELAALQTELEKLSALVRYDYYLQGYRMHQIFFDYLREKQKDLSRQEIKEICEIAAQWCLENNLKMDAAINYERAGDYAALAGIVETFPRIIPRVAASPLLDIINRLDQYEDRDETDGYFLYLRYIVRGRLLMCLARFDEATALFQENIRRFQDAPHSPAVLRVLAESWHYLGNAALVRRRYDNNDSYVECLEKADYYYKQNPYPVPSTLTICHVSAYVNQVSYPAAAGEIERRLDAFTACLPKAANSLNGYLSGVDELGRTELAYFQGDLASAEQYALRTVIRAREKNQYEIEMRGLFLLLRLRLHRGGLEDLLEVWKQKDSMLDIPHFFTRHVCNDMADGWMYTQMGEPNKAAPWLRNQFEAHELISMFHNYEAMIKAKYLYAEKQFADVVSFLHLKENRAGLGTYLLGMIEMHCLEAAARYQLGEEAAAAAVLEAAYEAAIPNSLIMPFIELGNDMRPLAAAALNAGSAIPRPWLEDIRNRASAYGKNLFTIAEQARSLDREISGAVYLTRRERAVLQGLSRGQTREEIAAATGQSLSAVKSLISRVCEKLGAVNRADAVRIASGMGIMET
jgi:LuxR family maltose regulon positive regulatory protein